MLRKLFGALFLLAAMLLTGLTGLVVYRAISGAGLPPLPPEVATQLQRVDELRPPGIPAEHFVGGVALVVVLFAWILLRRRPRVAGADEKAGGGGAEGSGRGGRVAAARVSTGSRVTGGPWVIALLFVGLCAAVIAAIYFGPDRLQLTDTIAIRRGPREKFLQNLYWGGGIIAGLHVVYFLLLALPRLLRRAPRRVA
ncbi:MAG: hypothetical protein HYZ53_11715 [Planctomycetes bacterium]|nr:hypothetical protein [Planctomycetota bacterium]